jgi:hypothetical protein
MAPTLFSAACWVTALLSLAGPAPAVAASCLGAPFLYISINGNPGVMKYSRDGCLLSKNILAKDEQTGMLRSMAVGSYHGRQALYLADAGSSDDSKNSKIILYGECNADGIRPYLATAVAQQELGIPMHAYGLALDAESNLYSSFQRAESVFRFSADTFKPQPLPPALQHANPAPAEGTFFQLTYASSGSGVRAIAFVGENLWIADERVDGITVVDPNGYSIRTIKMRNPIGVYYDAELKLVFVSSKSSYGLVYSIDPDTYETVNRYHRAGMTHPTGMVTVQDTLFVLRHQLGTVDTYSISSGKFLGAIISGFGKNLLEQVILSNC